MYIALQERERASILAALQKIEDTPIDGDILFNGRTPCGGLCSYLGRALAEHKFMSIESITLFVQLQVTKFSPRLINGLYIDEPFIMTKKRRDFLHYLIKELSIETEVR